MNSAKYHELRSWPPRRQAVRNAAGCGTETAVRLRTRSGRRAASPHATVAPQSWPTRCTGRPIRSISASMSATSAGSRYDVRNRGRAPGE